MKKKKDLVDEYQVTEAERSFIDDKESGTFSLAKINYTKAVKKFEKSLLDPQIECMVMLSTIITVFSTIFNYEGTIVTLFGTSITLKPENLFIVIPLIYMYNILRMVLKWKSYKKQLQQFLGTEQELNKFIIKYPVQLNLASYIKQIEPEIRVLFVPINIFSGFIAIYAIVGALPWLSALPSVYELEVFLVIWLAFLIYAILFSGLIDLAIKIGIFIIKFIPGLKKIYNLFKQFLRYSDEKKLKKELNQEEASVKSCHKEMFRHFNKIEGDLTDSAEDRIYEVTLLSILNGHETGTRLSKWFGSFFLSLIGLLTFVTTFLSTEDTLHLIMLFPFVLLMGFMIVVNNFQIHNFYEGFTYAMASRLNFFTGKDLILRDLAVIEESSYIERDKERLPHTMSYTHLSVPAYVILLLVILYAIIQGFLASLSSDIMFGYVFLAVFVVTIPLIIFWTMGFVKRLAAMRNKMAIEIIKSTPKELFATHKDVTDQSYLGIYSYYRLQNLILNARTMYVMFIGIFFFCVVSMSIRAWILMSETLQILNTLYIVMGFFPIMFYYYTIKIDARQIISYGTRIEEYLGNQDIFDEQCEKETKFLTTIPKKSLIIYYIPIVIVIIGQFIIFSQLDMIGMIIWAIILFSLVAYCTQKVLIVSKYLKRPEVAQKMDFGKVKDFTIEDMEKFASLLIKEKKK